MAGLINIAVAFSAVARKNDGLLSVLSEEMIKAGIDTPLRICHFLAQMAHESAGFTILQENLNYSADGLARIWPRRYAKDGKPNELALRLHRNPQGIANHTYANRMGNGDPASGDGWKYRGRGFVQITGKENYNVYSQSIFGDNRLLENPDLASDISVAAKIACAFWTRNKLNDLADKDDVVGITRRINGATIGIEHRKELLNKAKKAIGI